MTEYNENERFDQMVRSVLESGREEVPAGLWSSVAGRLPASGSGSVSRRPVFIHVARATAAVAVAASLAVGVVFTARQTSEAGRFDILGTGPVLTDIPSLAAPEMASASELPELSGRKPSSVPSTSAICGMPACTEASEAGTEEAVTPYEEEKGVAPEKGHSENKPTEINYIQPLADDFPGENDGEKSSKRAKVSLGAYTNAASNGTSTKAGAAIMRRAAKPSASGEAHSFVKETSAPVYGIPISAGLNVKVNFTDRWGLGVGLNYSYLSSRFDGVFTKDDGSSKSYSNIRNELHYIGIPVNVFFNIVDSRFMNFYTFAGGSIEKGLVNKYRMVSPEDGTLIHKENIGGFQFSAGLGLGVEFNITRHFSLYADPSIRYYFDTKQPHSIRTQQPFLAQIDLGFRVNF